MPSCKKFFSPLLLDVSRRGQNCPPYVALSPKCAARPFLRGLPFFPVTNHRFSPLAWRGAAKRPPPFLPRGYELDGLQSRPPGFPPAEFFFPDFSRPGECLQASFFFPPFYLSEELLFSPFLFQKIYPLPLRSLALFQSCCLPS